MCLFFFPIFFLDFLFFSFYVFLYSWLNRATEDVVRRRTYIGRQRTTKDERLENKADQIDFGAKRGAL